MLVSGGALVVKTPTFPFTPATTSDWWYGYERRTPAAAYGALYSAQLWVYVVVAKRARGTARLPLKVYERDDLNRPEAVGHPYRDLLRKPNPVLSPFRFWEWTSSTYDVYGEAMWRKQRDRGRRPIGLWPVHPTNLRRRDDGDGWDFDNGKGRREQIPEADIVHFRSYNPDDAGRGLSPLEPLRATLENEAAARTATSAFWRNGARPGTALVHQKNISEAAAARLKAQWQDVARGAGNTGITVVLEEGMEPKQLTLSAEEAQYIESRKLNREEVCAAYDVPPPVVHILDRATFSNITEQMRSMYRDTMAPHLGGFESDMETQLRAPDFGDEVYAEFLLEEVLRGDFEARAEAYRNADYMTMAEKRRAENLPFIEGTDRIFVNSATVPMRTGDDEDATPTELALMLQKLYLAVDVVITAEEARAILNRAGAGLPAALLPAPEPAQPALPAGQAVEAPVPAETLRSVMGRLSWQKTAADVDPAALVAGLADPGPVLAALAASKVAGEDVPALRARLRTMAKRSVQ